MSSHTRVSLAQQLAQLNLPAPPDFDPEDVDVTNNEIEDASDERSKAGRGHYLDVGPSSLRSKLHESLNDRRYGGVRVSRKQLEDNDDKLVSDDMPGNNTDDTLSRPVTSDEETERSEEEDDGKSDTVDAQGIPQRGASKAPEDSEAAPQVSNDQDPSSTLKRAREEERKKGRAVSKQLALFDGLLDARIRLQKCGTSMNRLPDSSKIPVYLDIAENRIAVNKLLHESLSLADHLFDLQEKLIAANEGFQFPNRKRRKIDPDSDIDCDWEEEVQESTSYFAELESTFHAHLLSTLQKWSNKVLAIAPSALLPSNRTKFSNNKNPNQVKSAVQLVDEALLERDKLISRTRVWRGVDTQLDSDTNFDPNSNTALSETPESRESFDAAAADVFDDTDFYQSLLRDVIDARSSSGGTTAVSGLEGLASNWRQTQKERKKARQKTIDTRASKGRKLRFEVHEKIQNFMAPAPQPGGGVPWHEEQIDELFASLLGKSFPDINDSVHPEDSENRTEMDIDAGEALKGGFRVFG